MSLSEIQETNNKNLYSRTMTVSSGFEGALGVIQYLNDAVVGPLTSPSRDLTIAETLVEGDTYLFLWQCQGGNTAATNAWQIDVFFDTAGQNDSIGFSALADGGAWGTDNHTYSGFLVLTIDSDGAGANKIVTFEADGQTDNGYLSTCRLFMMKVTIA